MILSLEERQKIGISKLKIDWFKLKAPKSYFYYNKEVRKWLEDCTFNTMEIYDAPTREYQIYFESAEERTLFALKWITD